jgi:hypothetical protein
VFQCLYAMLIARIVFPYARRLLWPGPGPVHGHQQLSPSLLQGWCSIDAFGHT